jgi:hypothetical protein
MNKTVNTALGMLKPGDTLADLSRAFGSAWEAPCGKGNVSLKIYKEGSLGPTYLVMARVTKDGVIGAIGFYGEFDGTIDVINCALGAPADSVLARMTNCERDAAESSPKYGNEAWRCDLGDGVSAIAIMREDRLVAFRMETVGAVYPGDLPPEAAKVRKGLKAYDLEMLHRSVDPADNHGWVFGLPPGITPAQWPLDPISGYPLVHGFTLRLPEDYRVHGPDIVALSFFATAHDQNDGGARVREDLQAAVLGAPAPVEESADLKPFRNHAATAHPRLYRMSDILDYAYAVILLTDAEFNGPLCAPPQFASNPYLRPNVQPKWLSSGAAHAFFQDSCGMWLNDMPLEDLFIYRQIGAVPEARLDWHRAIGCTPRAIDPNAGIPPVEVYEEPSELGYQSAFDRARDYELKPWAVSHRPDHIGGTMRPVQGTPEFSPFYIGFEEYFGGYNFGSGSAQLDIMLMKFDWACG